MTRLDEIRTRLAAATPGPWKSRTSGDNSWRDAGPAWIGGFHDCAKADATMITNAPEDLAYLLAKVERLQMEVAAERAATVGFLRNFVLSEQSRSIMDLAFEAIERGEHWASRR